jgi:crotonobetainyl-CoA:carnitine CoA-transferase CaiB-like acyl-CoA transferase
MSTIAGSLNGLRVLDFTRVFAGPLCTQILADLGAEVLKIERPGVGDETREWGPPFAGGESAYFLGLNRGKASLMLDLGNDSDLQRAHDLALRADVLIENFRAGWLSERGLGYDALRAENPGLVYCSLTAYGQTGPDASLPGYDFLIQARSGLMSITGEADGPPTKVGVAVSDVQAGLYPAIGIQAALLRRAQTGDGAYLDLSLLDCQIAGLANVASSYLVSGQLPQRHGNGHPSIVPYRIFEAADGPFALAVGNDGQWRKCCAVIGRPAWAQEARYRTNADRVVNRVELERQLAEIFAVKPRAAWLEELRKAGVPAGPLQTLDEVFDDAQVTARGMLTELEHPSAGVVRSVASPLLREETPVGAPPRLGEGGEEMARRWISPVPE